MDEAMGHLPEEVTYANLLGAKSAFDLGRISPQPYVGLPFFPGSWSTLYLACRSRPL